MDTMFKRLLSLLIVLVMVIGMVPGQVFAAEEETVTADTDWYSDDATEFTLDTLAEFLGFAELAQTNTFAGKTITLSTSIDLTGRTWAPIPSFAGTFDGGNKTITGISVTGSTAGLGFFGTVSSGTVQNLILENVSVKGTATAASKVAAVAGTLANGTLKNVHATGTVITTGNQVGGLVGQLEGSSKDSVIENCSFGGSVTGAKNVGGLVGFVNAAKSLTVTGCTNNAAVKMTSSGSRAGGLIGYVNNSTANSTIVVKLENCTNNGTVTGTGSLGSIVGVIQGASGKKVTATFTDVTDSTGMETKWNVSGSSYVTVEEITTEEPEPTEPEETEPVDPNAPDTSWYVAEQTVFTIDTLGELLGFAELAKTYDFAGQTVTLDADISLADVTWEPIGKHEVTSTNKPGKVFAGTFDGGENKITGLSMTLVSGNKYYGLFGQVSGTIKNLTLEANITGTASGHVGSVVGMLSGGTLENVHSTATVDVTSNFVGGLVGSVSGTGNSTIDNCSFSNAVCGSKHVGGLAGYINASSLNITGSENKAAVSTKVADSNVGGLIGFVQRGTAVITSSENNGMVSLGEFAGNAGTIIGRIDGDTNGSASVTFDDVTNTKEQTPACVAGYNVDAADLVADEEGNALVTITGTVGGYAGGHSYEAVVTAPTCVAAGYTTYTCSACGDSYVDDEVAATGEHNYENGTCTVCGVVDSAALDTSWYSAEQTDFTIDTLGKLLGFAELAKTYDFAGQTVTLGADISLADVTWTPIGYHKNGSNTFVGEVFAGTFDGGEHTITGLNIAFTGKEGYQGLFGTVSGTVKDLVLEDVQISGTASTNRIGSVVGSLKGGTLENVDATATIDVAANFVGGLVGAVEGSDASTITGCTFTGTVTGNQHIGGIVGFINASTVELASCQNNGTVSAKVDASNVGGLIGYVQRSTATITDSHNYGAVSNGQAGTVGTVIGLINGDENGRAYVTLENATNETTQTAACVGYNVDAADLVADEEGNAFVTITGEVGGIVSEHSYGGVVTAPTCGDAGYTTYTCSVCGHSYIADEVEATGEHVYDEGAVTKEATCGEDGEMTYTCDICKDTYTEAIDATGEHSYVDGKCTVCGEAQASITLSAASLNLLDQVCIIYETTDDQIVTNDALVAERGVLLYASETAAQNKDATQLNETIVLEKNDAGKYVGQSQGIDARDMAESQFAVAYLKLTDGTYIFGTKEGKEQIVEFSPLIYCLEKKDDAVVGELCRALMHYGAAAQVAQYNMTEEEGLMNAGFEAIDYKESVLGETSVFSANTRTTNGMKLKSVTMALKGAISYIVKFTADGVPSDKTLYAEYTLLGETETVELEKGSDGKLWATISGVAAKDLDATLTVKPYYLDENEEKVYGGELVFSGYEYTRIVTKNAAYEKDIKDLAKALAMYVSYADAYAKTVEGQ